MSELCSILSLFEKGTMLVQNENNVIGSLETPVTLSIEHQMSQISVNYGSNMIKALNTFVESVTEPDTDLFSNIEKKKIKKRNTHDFFGILP